jgi:dihydroorotate dehydrogenase (fumarate)
MTIDLSTRYLGLDLANPLVASASPMTGHIESLHELAAAGVSAVVLPSLFEEQIEEEALHVHHGLEYGAAYQPEAVGGYFPELDDYNTGPDEYLDLIRQAKEELSIPVIGSLNGVSAGGWTTYARHIEEAGADALELNIYLVAADITVAGSDVESQYLALVEEVRSTVSIPLSVKVGPYFSSPGHMAHRLVDAGADGLVLFNRFYQPDIDLEELAVKPSLELSRSVEARLALRWIAILSPTLSASLAATTGIHTAADAVKMLLAGADVTMMTSALLEHGARHAADVLAGMVEWFVAGEYDSVAQARGSVNVASIADPATYERANYMRTLTSYAPAELL